MTTTIRIIGRARKKERKKERTKEKTKENTTHTAGKLKNVSGQTERQETNE